MKYIIHTLAMALLSVAAQAQPHVQKAVEQVAHSPWVTKHSDNSFSNPTEGRLVRRNREWRLTIPPSGVNSIVSAFEQDSDCGYTYALTSAAYNRLALPSRHVEMRLQNDMRLSSSAFDYSYVLLNVLDTADTRFRTTYIFQWWPAEGEQMEARLYVLYGLRPATTTQETRSAAHPVTKGDSRSDDVERYMATLRRDCPYREMIERDPLTGALETHNRSMLIADRGRTDTARRMLDAIDLAACYRKQTVQTEVPRQTTTHVCFTDGQRADGRYRTAYILVQRDDMTQLHATYGEMGYDEMVSDFLAPSGSTYVIGNKVAGGSLSCDAEGMAVLSRQPVTATVNHTAYGYQILIDGRALADDKVLYHDRNHQLFFTAPDVHDARQSWVIVSQGKDQWNLINAATRRTLNLANGSTDDGSPIIGYTTDKRNATSKNRLWSISKQ